MNAVTAPRDLPMSPKKWYREPWPWILASGPALVIVAGIATAVVAFTGADGLVADDYYKQGLSVNRQIARDAAASELRIEGELQAGGGKVTLALRSAAPLPDRLTLRLAHPARAADDRTVHLARRADGLYEAPLPELGATRWLAIVETAQWRVSATLDPKSGGRAPLSPGVR